MFTLNRLAPETGMVSESTLSLNESFANNDRGIITFGEIPQEIVDHYKNYGRCPALNKEVNGKFYSSQKGLFFLGI